MSGRQDAWQGEILILGKGLHEKIGASHLSIKKPFGLAVFALGCSAALQLCWATAGMGFHHVLLAYSSTCFGMSALCFLLKWLLLRDSRNSKLSLASDYAGGVEVAGAHCIW
jgi:hypothetical protein